MPEQEKSLRPEWSFLPGKVSISLRTCRPRLRPTSFSEASPEEAAAQLERTLGWGDAGPSPRSLFRDHPGTAPA
ncbi:MAG TPA: hypothetical protein VNO81_13130 [Candidatus Nitrosotenuis sp.]|nr:hypothetical protein [Candidatus Nitrosotenuis sp.]